MSGEIKAIERNMTSTLDGRDWLTMALDPFHDLNVPVKGYPDELSTSTAMQTIRKIITIVKPTELADTDTWDCHIATIPLADTVHSWANSIANPRGHYDLTGAATVATLGTVTVSKCKSDQQTFPQDDTVFNYTDKRQIYGYSGTDTNNKSPSRLIAGGFEVHNATAELERQGSVTVYSMPNSMNQPSPCRITGATGGVIGLSSARVARMPPARPDLAAIMNDARTWKAADGVYVPFRLNTESEGFRLNARENGAFALTTNDSGAGDATTKFIVSNTEEDGINVTASGAPTGDIINLRTMHGTSTNVNGSYVAADELPGISGYKQAPIQTSGAYFSGLSAGTVLTLNIRYLLEVAPTAANPELLYTTSPSPLYDPRALETYTNIINRMPPGVPVDMNAKGDFWRLIKGVGKTVGKLLLPIAPPVVQVAVKGVANVVKEVKKNKSKKPSLLLVPRGQVSRPANVERNRSRR